MVRGAQLTGLFTIRKYYLDSVSKPTATRGSISTEYGKLPIESQGYALLKPSLYDKSCWILAIHQVKENEFPMKQILGAA